MERINGDRLDSIWTSLGRTQKKALALQVRASFIKLRKLRSPDCYCSLDVSLFEIIYSIPEIQKSPSNLRALST